ncbi:MAG: hypothetical protein OJI74_16495, partial [Rhodanobacter thiooxydans]|nr:hypothetical protein [Rhodanobacter thiooxydans]
MLSQIATDALRMVYFRCKKITMSDHFYYLPNLQTLAKVHEACILSAVSDQNPGKLNCLLAGLRSREPIDFGAPNARRRS